MPEAVEKPYHGELIFTIGHRFGNIRSGFYEIFGLDIASIRLGLNYGINSWLAPMTHLNLEYIPSVVGGGIERTKPLSAGFDIETGGNVFQLFFQTPRE